MRTVTFHLLPIIALSAATATGSALARDLTFEERVKAQEAIERVYYSHQIGATLAFEQAVPHPVIEEKVHSFLRQSAALEEQWRTLVTGEALHRELERILAHTRFPARVIEIYRALGQDPVLMEECFVRPILVERLTRNFVSFDARIQDSSRKVALELRERVRTGVLDPGSTFPHRWTTEVLRGEAGLPDPGTGGERSENAPATGLERRVLPPEEFSRERARLPRHAGVPGPITEDRDVFSFQLLLADDPDRFITATYSIPKLSWDSWWRTSATRFEESPVSTAANDGAVEPSFWKSQTWGGGSTAASPLASGSLVADDTWSNGILDDMPDSRYSHSSVWTGNRMIVWGGYDSSGYLDSGALYDPLTDTWAPTSRLGAPAARCKHSAVWTGSRMIIWGGINTPGTSYLASGGMYDPISDTWTSVASAGAPSGRTLFTTIWTGSQMIIWGGSYVPAGGGANIYLNDGARYDPASDTWVPTSQVNAPAAREDHSAVWTGSRMIIWGGHNPGTLYTGGRYDPVTDTWTPTAVGGAPSPREGHSAVWTGSRMIVWGGGWPLTNTGGRYDPVTDTWQPTSVSNAPVPRVSPSTIWTGSQMIIWGGVINGDTGLNTGGRYDPASDVWIPTTTGGAPSARGFHTAVWTGSLMVVWGGYNYSLGSFQSGGRYDPATDGWTPTSMGSAPSGRTWATGVWTGNFLVVWGGTPALATGGRYDPLADDWTPTATLNAPEGRAFHTAVWTGNVMIIWGGSNQVGATLATGGRYEPVSNSWAPTATTLAPDGRVSHTTVWTGATMVVWGGSTSGGGVLNSGGRYDPVADSWSPVSLTGAPAARSAHTAVWTGTSMIIWGGSAQGSPIGTGGRYDPVADQWLPVSDTNAPSPRSRHAAVWTGTQMVIWGGSPSYDPSVGGRYDPVSDSWSYTSTIGVPSGRFGLTGIWTGHLMVVWGGYASSLQNTGGRYDPVADTWTSTSTLNAPLARAGHIAVWTGESMIVWGGYRSMALKSGGRYSVVEDLDGDSIPPGVDNCPDVYNPGEEDSDLDGVGDACDCAPDDPTAYAPPAEVSGLRWDSESVLRWDSLQVQCGSGAVYDIIQGNLGTGSIGGAGAACMVIGASQTFLEDSTVPAGAGEFYLTRGRNNCGAGTYGSDQRDASIPSCP